MDRLTKGGTCVLVDGFKPATFWDTVRRFENHGVLPGGSDDAVPPSARRRVNTTGITRCARSSPCPATPDARSLAERYGLEMHTAFNMTEMAADRSSANPGSSAAAAGRAGIEARLVDENDSASRGEVGELILRTEAALGDNRL